MKIFVMNFVICFIINVMSYKYLLQRSSFGENFINRQIERMIAELVH